MRTTQVIFAAIFVITAVIEAKEICSTNQPVERVYIMKRRLSFSPFRFCYLSHTALLVQMADNKQCLLEYLTDGRAHLYDAQPLAKLCLFKKCRMLMPDNKGELYLWEREQDGARLPVHSPGHTSPQLARDKMQSMMGIHYNLLNNNCHHAQEKLRSSWGLTVKHPYVNAKSFCNCFRRVPNILKGFFEDIGDLCDEIAG